MENQEKNRDDKSCKTQVRVSHPVTPKGSLCGVHRLAVKASVTHSATLACTTKKRKGKDRSEIDTGGRRSPKDVAGGHPKSAT